MLRITGLVEYLITTVFFTCTYFLFYMVQVKVLGDFDFLPMVSILFIPAGVKFLAMLVGRGAGVFGVLVGVELVNLYTGKSLDMLQIGLHAVGWILLPYACMVAYLRQREHGQNLIGLTTFDVIALVIVVSLVSSIGSQLYWNGFDAAGVPLIRAIWGMFVGDIAGIFLALGVVLVTRKVFSRANIETSS
jgi:hypothetical protein|tara:strand:+ start:179 stop:748 length:570 start_codon:yes stop_codon:yes gene_type:complete